MDPFCEATFIRTNGSSVILISILIKKIRQNKKTKITVLQRSSYTKYHEMPQKACERGFCHVIAGFGERVDTFFSPRMWHHLSDSENEKNGAFQKIQT